ncbi:MAG: ABC transporter substrate-binding protein [Candidatus Hodarchaeota archaeon]
MYQERPILFLLFLTLTLLCVVTPVPVRAYEPPWEGQSREWYWDNLNNEDRLKIRQAIDYCIPREMIIEGMYHGYAVAIPSPIGVNFKEVYEDSITAREYNTSKATALLTSVFSYKYDEHANGTNKTHTNVPYFQTTLIVEANNTMMADYGALITIALAKVGIELTIEEWSSEKIKRNIFNDPPYIGLDSRYPGGYDMFLYSFKSSPDPLYKEYYDSDYFPPAANCYWINDGAPTSGKWTNKTYPNVTALWTEIYAEPRPTRRTRLLKEYQQWCSDQVPTCIIHQEMALFGVDPGITGFDTFHGLQQNLANLTIGSQTSAVIAYLTKSGNLNPLLTTNKSPLLLLDNIFCRLARRRGAYNLTHAVPWLAESWNHSPSYLTWDVNLRQGILWEDGTELTAEDVVFSYHAAMNENLSSPYRDTLLDILGATTAVEQTSTYGIRFTLPQIYPYIETVLFGNPPIVQRAQMAQIPLTKWKTNDTNINKTPKGCGAYRFDSYPEDDTIILTANPFYNETTMGHNPIMEGGGNWVPTPQLSPITFKVVNDPIIAVAGLKDGIYDIIDSQISFQLQAAYIQGSSWGRLLQGYKWQYYEIGINQMNSLFGMNAKDPREILYYPPPDPNRMNPIYTFFPTYIAIPLFILVLESGFIITRQMKPLSFSSKKAAIVWYIVTGITIIAISFLPVQTFEERYVYQSISNLIILLGFLALLWPVLFVLTTSIATSPMYPYEGGPLPPNIWQFELHELETLSTFLFGICIGFFLSELLVRAMTKRKQKEAKVSSGETTPKPFRSKLERTAIDSIYALVQGITEKTPVMSSDVKKQFANKDKRDLIIYKAQLLSGALIGALIGGFFGLFFGLLGFLFVIGGGILGWILTKRLLAFEEVNTE